MGSYVVPQVEIHQLFSEIPVSLTRTQVPFVFGANYLLHRYGVTDEKNGTYLGSYDEAVQEGGYNYFWPYPGALDEEAVDKSYTKLFGDNVLVQLHTFNTVNRVAIAGTVGSYEPSLIDITLDDSSSDSSSSEEQSMYPEVTVGRQLRLFINNSYTDVMITDIDYENSTAEKLRVEIDEELPGSADITKAILCEVQNGVEFSRKKLNDPNKTAFYWTAYKDVDATSLTYGHYGIKILLDLEAKIEDDDFTGYGKVLSAELYLTYRELLTSASDTIHSLTTASEVANALGAIHPDNPLAQAVYNAALNAGGQTIRYMAVPTDDSDGYSAVLNKATLTKEVYFLVPATRDATVLDLVQSHVNSMSAATSKRWRIAFVSAEIPDNDPIYTSTADTSGDDFNAIVKSLNTVDNTADVQFVVEQGETWVADPNTSFKKDLAVGDVLYINFDNIEWGEKVPTKCYIKKIVNNNTIRVDNAEAGLVITTEGEKAEIYHPYTNAQKAEVIRDLSSSFADRRMYNVFPSIFSNAGVQQTGEFAAACVAGLVSSCLPQQPVTNLELVGIDDIPLVYQTFSYDQLNTMASGGTFIVMQDLPNDQVYIRHQISTDYEANNLNTAELSITKNLDSISYFFDDLLSPYIGKYNITPELLALLKTVISTGLTSLESSSYGLYGPQLIAEGTELLLLEQDALLKDHVNCNLQLNMPYPFNHLVLKLFV